MAKKKAQTLPPLSESQREIMEIIWDLGEATVSDVRDVLLRRRSVARNTVRTLIERMEEKGWLTHRHEERTYFYSAALPRDVLVGQKVVQVIDQVCGGSPETLMAALLDYRGMSTAELERVRKMLSDATAARKKRGRSS